MCGKIYWRLPGISSLDGVTTYRMLFFLVNAGTGIEKLVLEHGFEIRAVHADEAKQMIAAFEGIPINRILEHLDGFSGRFFIGNVARYIEVSIPVEDQSISYAPSDRNVNEFKQATSGYIDQILMKLRLIDEGGIASPLRFEIETSTNCLKRWGAGYWHATPSGQMTSLSLESANAVRHAQYFIDHVDLRSVCGRLQNAISAYDESYMVHQPYLKCLLSVIGIECLFDLGKRSSQERTQELCAEFCKPTARGYDLDALKKLYELRNDIVHRGKTAGAKRFVFTARGLLRTPIERILLSGARDFDPSQLMPE